MHLYVPDHGDDPLTAALAYASAGWYVLPVKRGTKNPGSIVGAQWHLKSSRDPQQITAWLAGTDHGIALHAGRSRAIVLDVDKPGLVPLQMAQAIQDANPPVQLTRRDPLTGQLGLDRGHYLFRQPEGKTIGNSGGKLGKAWGEVRGLNGIIVVAPSIHPEPDGQYRWVQRGPVPALPSYIAEQLAEANDNTRAASSKAVDEFIARYNHGESVENIEGILTRFRADVRHGHGRHASAIDAACWAAREAARGMYPAKAAFDLIRAEFLESLNGERDGNAEWRNILAWSIGQVSTQDTAPPLTSENALRATETAERASPQGTGTVDHERQGVTDTPVRRGNFAGVRTRKRAEARYLRRSDGVPMLYPGKDSYLYAETESGKSWLVAHGVRQLVTDGVPILVVDFEEGDEIEYGNRLLDLGLTEDKLNDSSLFRYLMVDQKATTSIMREAEEMNAQVVIYEGMSVAYDVYGLQVKENDSATAFRRRLVKPHLLEGRAVLTTDHVVKDRDSRGRYAIGGVMKLNAASGGAFLLENKEGLAPGKRGVSYLYSTKDRPGDVKRHCTDTGKGPSVKFFGSLVVDSSHERFSYLEVEITAPKKDERQDDSLSPLAYSILEAIDRIRGNELEPNLRKIRAEVGGNARSIDEEIERMVTRGVVKESAGQRRARVFDRSKPVDGEGSE